MNTTRVKTCALRSGSSGNSIFISSESTRLLIDAGVNAKTVELALNEIDETAARLDGIFITHEHTDHIAGVGVLMRRFKVPVYANAKTWQAMRRSVGKVDESLIRLLPPRGSARVGDLSINSFETPHDAVSSVGYKIESDYGIVSVFTDIGSLSKELLETVAGSEIVFIEANYDHAMLMAGAYPEHLKQRIVGSHGHLSNDDCALAVLDLLKKGTQKFILSHLSKDNNFPELAVLTVDSHLRSEGASPGEDFQLEIASRFAVSKPVCF